MSDEIHTQFTAYVLGLFIIIFAIFIYFLIQKAISAGLSSNKPTKPEMQIITDLYFFQM